MMVAGKPRSPIMRVLIVDDEPLAREGVRQLLASQGDAVVVGECEDGIRAVEMIQRKHPDIVFLDIQMPEMDGFEVLRAIGAGAVPVVIFVTAHDAYALRAFDVHAVDYILKPVDPGRFRDVMERARVILRGSSRLPSRRVESRLEALLSDLRSGQHYRERLVVKSNKRIVVLRCELIDWIEAKGDYVIVHAEGKKYLMRDKIGALQEQLDPGRFVRIHRSTIVNADRIAEMQPQHHGEHSVLLRDGTRLTLSRGYRDKAFRRISAAR